MSVIAAVPRILDGYPCYRARVADDTNSSTVRPVDSRFGDEGFDAVLAALRTPRVLLAAGLSLLVFWWVGGLLSFPYEGPFDATLLHQPLAVAKFVAVAFVLLVMTAVGTLIAGRVRYDAGWGAAVFGLLGLRWRGDDTYYAVDGHTSGVYITFAIELAILAVIAAVLWALLHWLRERGSQMPGLKRILELPDPKSRLDDRKATRETLDQKFLALLCSTGVTAAVVMIVARTDDETQVFFAVLLGGWIGAMMAHAFIATRPGPWFWAGPILAGLIGYIAAALSTPPELLATGEPGGYLAPLARPMPIDWLAAGVPMALVGYVRSRTKQYQRVVEAQAK